VREIACVCVWVMQFGHACASKRRMCVRVYVGIQMYICICTYVHIYTCLDGKERGMCVRVYLRMNIHKCMYFV
jgi:hypothetical protein